jgi:hypothetical protein
MALCVFSKKHMQAQVKALYYLSFMYEIYGYRTVLIVGYREYDFDARRSEMSCLSVNRKDPITRGIFTSVVRDHKSKYNIETRKTHAYKIRN